MSGRRRIPLASFLNPAGPLVKDAVGFSHDRSTSLSAGSLVSAASFGSHAEGVAGPGPSTAAGWSGQALRDEPPMSAPEPSFPIGTWENPQPFVLPQRRKAPSLPAVTPPRSPSPDHRVEPDAAPLGTWENPTPFVLEPTRQRAPSPRTEAEVTRLIRSQKKRPNSTHYQPAVKAPAGLPSAGLVADEPKPAQVNAPAQADAPASPLTQQLKPSRPTWATADSPSRPTAQTNAVTLTEQVTASAATPRAGQSMEVDDPEISSLMARLRTPSPPLLTTGPRPAADMPASAVVGSVAALADLLPPAGSSLPTKAEQGDVRLGGLAPGQQPRPTSTEPLARGRSNSAASSVQILDEAPPLNSASVGRRRLLTVEVPRAATPNGLVERDIESARQKIASRPIIRDDSPDIEMLDDAAAARIAWKPSQKTRHQRLAAAPPDASASDSSAPEAGPSRRGGLRRSVRGQGAERPAPTYLVEPAEDFFAALNAPSSPPLEPNDADRSSSRSARSDAEESEIDNVIDAPPKYTMQELRDLFERMKQEAEASAHQTIRPAPHAASQSGRGATIDVDGKDRTVNRYFPIFTPPPSDDAESPADEEALKNAVVLATGTPTVPEFEQPPPDRRGTALRQFDMSVIADWAKNQSLYADNPTIYRLMFENWIWESADERGTSDIRVINPIDREGAPPEVEFQYSNQRLYHKDVPDPELSIGCDCEGGCDPESETCRCLKIQKLYSYDVDLEGFAYDRNGLLKHAEVPVWECGPRCRCGPECINRVIQRGRQKTAPVDLFKTRKKGWGVQVRDIDRNRYRDPAQRHRLRDEGIIPRGTFLGIYTGELITEAESERRGSIYEKIGRTYLFDCDGWQIANPPPIYELHAIDPRLAQLAAEAAEKYRAAQSAREEDDDSSYSSYSVDAFHFGNFTRYFNHSCDPNLAITQAYVGDWHPERPSLVIFTRRDVRPGEELCISYKGLPVRPRLCTTAAL